MKKIYYWVAVCGMATAMTSCELKEDMNFDETASMRSEANIQHVHEILQSAENGWLMEYYGNLNFGGYNVMVKFTEDQVTVGSEKWGSNHVAGIDTEGKAITTTSHYKMEQSMGTILSFDEYNETFHYYSMPNNPDYTYDTAEGLSGDFEFRVMSASADSVILRGKKNNNRIVMTPIPATKTWESIITAASETARFMESSSYTLSGEDYQDTVKIDVTTNSYRCLIFTYTDSVDMTQTIAAPYIVKDDGYWFYSPVTVNGVELDGLLKGDTEDYFLFRNNSKLQLDSYMPPLAEHLSTGTWYLNYGSLNDYARPMWDAMMEVLKTAGKNNDMIKIYTATIGLTSDNKLAASMSTSTDAPYWGMSVTTVADDKVVINSNSTLRNKAGRDYYNKYKWKDVLNTMFGHTFTITSDNLRHPSYLQLIDDANPTNVITVYATPMYFMNDQSYYDN